VNLLLIAAGLRTRAALVPSLVEVMGWCSVARDLDDDLRKGLINGPAEVVAGVRAQGELTARDPIVTRWLDEEKRAIRPRLDAAAAELRTVASTDPAAGRLLGTFHRSVARYAR
jgi:hypothetical protein